MYSILFILKKAKYFSTISTSFLKTHIHEAAVMMFTYGEIFLNISLSKMSKSCLGNASLLS